MMLPNATISRRTLLRGVGTALALPLLDAMMPRMAVAALASEARRSGPPLRMAFLYVPNGKHMPDWTPAKEGALGTLPHILEPLTPFKQDIMVLSGLTCDKARAHGDGGGDHARAMSAFLTGCQPRKTHGADIRAGTSVDQYAAQKIGDATRFPSLEIGCEGGRAVGNCDSGYSCAYNSTVSWRTETTPVPKEVNPKLVFDRLFSGGAKGEADAARKKRDAYRKSVLDFVRADAEKLSASLGAADKSKLDEYLTAVREIEQRVTKFQGENAKPVARPSLKLPDNTPKDYAEHLRLMADILTLAFQADLTRVATFVFANESSNRAYAHIGVPEGHHDLSHHGNDAKKQEKIRAINRFHTTQLAYFLDKLKRTPDANGGSLLDNSMILYGSGNGDGNRHNHDELPVLLAGKAGGTLSPGRHVRYAKETPLTNLYLEMLDRVGVKATTFGDSTGRLPGLKA